MKPLFLTFIRSTLVAVMIAAIGISSTVYSVKPKSKAGKNAHEKAVRSAKKANVRGQILSTREIIRTAQKAEIIAQKAAEQEAARAEIRTQAEVTQTLLNHATERREIQRARQAIGLAERTELELENLRRVGDEELEEAELALDLEVQQHRAELDIERNQQPAPRQEPQAPANQAAAINNESDTDNESDLESDTDSEEDERPDQQPAPRQEPQAPANQAMAHAGMNQPAQTMWQKTQAFFRNNSGKIAITAITCGIVGLLYYSNKYYQNYLAEQLNEQEQASVYCAHGAIHGYANILYDLNKIEQQSFRPFYYLRSYLKEHSEKYTLQYAKDILQAAYDLCSKCKTEDDYPFYLKRHQSYIDHLTPNGLKYFFELISDYSYDSYNEWV